MTTIKSSTTLNTAYNVVGDTTGTLVFQTGATPTTAMTIDTSQNVGIGTSSPTSILHLSANSPIIKLNNNASNDTPYIQGGTSGAGGDGYLYLSGGVNRGVKLAYNAGTVGATLDSSGNFQMNSGYGSAATAYGCRAWANFAGSTGTMRGSGNMTSITRNGTGNYTANFASAMPDSNYVIVIGNNEISGGTSSGRVLSPTSVGTAPSIMSTTAVQFIIDTAGGTLLDVYYVGIAIFR